MNQRIFMWIWVVMIAAGAVFLGGCAADDEIADPVTASANSVYYESCSYDRVVKDRNSCSSTSETVTCTCGQTVRNVLVSVTERADACLPQSTPVACVLSQATPTSPARCVTTGAAYCRALVSNGKRIGCAKSAPSTIDCGPAKVVGGGYSCSGVTTSVVTSCSMGQGCDEVRRDLPCSVD